MPLITETGKGFVKELEASSQALVTDFSPSSESLLIAFGGIKGFRAIPPLEFATITQDIPTKKIFLRDFSQSWYQAGLPGQTKSLEETASLLRQHIHEQGIRHLVTVGNSMGGYAALLFGALLGAQVALAFSPQTYLHPAKRLLSLDFRWQKQMRRAQEACQNPLHLDLRSYFLQQPARPKRVEIYYSGLWDSLHALNLRGLGMNLHHHLQGSHNLVRQLRQTGALREIILHALQEGYTKKI